MDEQIQTIIEAIKDVVGKKWNDDHTPYMLSNLGPDLRARDIDYKSILGGLRLKEFVAANGKSAAKIIQHPSQRAKIGLVPAGQDYAFPEEEQESKSEAHAVQTHAHQPRRPRNARHVVMNFLEALADLSPEELQSVQIPVSVLARLVAGK